MFVKLLLWKHCCCEAHLTYVNLQFVPATLYRDKLINLPSLTRSVNTKVIFRWKLWIIEINLNHCSRIPPKDLLHTRSDFLSMNKCILKKRVAPPIGQADKRRDQWRHYTACCGRSAPSYKLNKGYAKMLCLFKYAKDYEACSHHLLTQKCNSKEIIYNRFIVPLALGSIKFIQITVEMSK